MLDQDWIEMGWRLFCPRAARFWRYGIWGLDEDLLIRLIQWYEEEDAESESDWSEIEQLPEEERGDPVFRVSNFPPLPVWVGAMACFLRQNGIEMGILKLGSEAIVVQNNPVNQFNLLDKAAPEKFSPVRCGKCPYHYLCHEF